MCQQKYGCLFDVIVIIINGLRPNEKVELSRADPIRNYPPQQIKITGPSHYYYP